MDSRLSLLRRAWFTQSRLKGIMWTAGRFADLIDEIEDTCLKGIMWTAGCAAVLCCALLCNGLKGIMWTAGTTIGLCLRCFEEVLRG